MIRGAGGAAGGGGGFTAAGDGEGFTVGLVRSWEIVPLGITTFGFVPTVTDFGGVPSLLSVVSFFDTGSGLTLPGFSNT